MKKELTPLDDNFEERKTKFYEEREFYTHMKSTYKGALVRDWQKRFASIVNDVAEVEKLQDEMERKTTKDGLLKIAFQLTDLSGLKNPLLFSTRRTFTARKKFLRSIFETVLAEKLLPNPITSEKNHNPGTIENLL